MAINHSRSIVDCLKNSTTSLSTIKVHRAGTEGSTCGWLGLALGCPFVGMGRILPLFALLRVTATSPLPPRHTSWCGKLLAIPLVSPAVRRVRPKAVSLFFSSKNWGPERVPSCPGNSHNGTVPGLVLGTSRSSTFPVRAWGGWELSLVHSGRFLGIQGSGSGLVQALSPPGLYLFLLPSEPRFSSLSNGPGTPTSSD